MNPLKMFLCIVLVIAFLPGTAKGKSDSCSELPTIKKLNKEFCPKDGKYYGHTLVILDLTPSVELEQAQIDSINERVFSENFYKKYQPFTKFSYVLISKERPQSQQPYLAICRPKTGKKNTDYCDHANRWKESSKHVKKKWEEFMRESKKTSESIFQEQQGASNSLIYETIVSVFKFPKFDFGDNYPERNLIVVSDMMQHSERLSFYNSCRSWNSVKPNRCPELYKVLTPSTREYIEGTSRELKKNSYDNVGVEVILLNNRYEASPNLTPSLKNLWKEFFREFFGKEDVKFDLPLDTN